jgi:hypothetical protein
MTTNLHSGTKQEHFQNKQISYELYPTLKISPDSLLSFEEIIGELEKGRNKPIDTSGLKVKGIPVKDLPDYFNRIKDKLQEFIDSINQKIIDKKLGTEYSETNSTISQQKDRILEEHQGLINEEINNLLIKSFKKKMRKQPNCNDEKKFSKGVKLETPITNSSDLNKKIYSKLEICFEFLTKLLLEYCNQFGWQGLSVSKDVLLKKVEKQGATPTTTTPTYSQTTPTYSQTTPTYSQTTYTSSSVKPTTTTPTTTTNNRFDSLSKQLAAIGFGPKKGGALKSKKKINNKNKKNILNKNSKKQKKNLKNNISRKSNSRYMRVSKNKK